MINAGKILAYLDLDGSGFGNALDIAQGQLTSFAQEGGGISGILEGVGATATAVGRALTLGVTTPLVGLATTAVATGMSFDASMSNVLALSGATATEFADLRNMAQEMGAATKFSATQAADAFGYMALAGWDAQQMIGGIPGVLDLAAAANMDLARASDIVTDTMTPFAMAAEEAGRAADVFAYAQANSNTNVLQLGDAMKYVAPNAAAFSMTLEDTAAALGILANAGIKGSMGGTTLNAVLRDLKKNAEDGAIAIGKTKVSIVEADGSYRSYVDIMRDIETATAGMSESQRDAALAAVFGDEAIKGVNATLAQGVDALESFTDELNDCEGAAANMAATTQDNLLGDITTLKSGIEGMAIALSDFLNPALRKVTQWITSGVQWFNSLDTSIKNIVFRVGAVVAAIGPVLLVGGQLLTMVSGFAGPLGLMAGGFALVYQHSERLQGAVSKAKDALAGLFDGVKDGFAVYTDAVAGGESKTSALAKALTTAFGASTANSIQRVTNTLRNGFTRVVGDAKNVSDAVGSFIGALIDGEPVLQSLETSLSKVFGADTVQRVMAIAGAVRSSLVTAFGYVTDIAGTAKSALMDFIDNASDAFDTLKDRLSSLMDTIRDKVLDAKDSLVTLADDFKAAWQDDGIMGVLGVLGEKIGNALRSAASAAQQGAQYVRERISDGLAMAQAWFAPKAQTWMSNLGNALQSAQSYVTSKLPAVRTAIANGLQVTKDTLTTKAKEVMTWLGDAYRSDTVQNLIGDLSGVASNILSKINAAKETIFDKAGELVNALGTAMGSEAIKAKIEDLSGVAANIASKITSNLGAWQTAAATLLGDLVTQMTNTGFTETMLSGLGSVAQGIVDGISTAAINVTEAAANIIANLTGALLSDGVITTAFTTAGDVLAAIMNAIGNAVLSGTEAASGIITKIFSALGSVNWTTVSSAAQETTKKLLDAIATAVPKVTTGLSSLVSAITEGIGKVNWSSMGSSLGTFATNLIDGIMNNLPATIEGIDGLVSKIGEGIKTATTALTDVATGFISSFVSWLFTPGNVTKLLQSGLGIATSIATGVLELGASVVAGAAESLFKVINETITPYVAEILEKTDVSLTMLELGAVPLDLDGLQQSFDTYGNALEVGIADVGGKGSWIADDMVRGLFAVMIDTQNSEAERAKAMAVLIMSDYGHLISNAILQGEPELFAAATELLDGTNEEINKATEALGAALPLTLEEGLNSGIPILEAAAGKVAEVASGTQDKVTTLADAKTVGEEAVSSVAEGEQAMLSETETATQAVSDSITGTLEPLPGLMEELSQLGVTGMETAITTGTPAVTTAMDTLSNETVNAALQNMSVETGTEIGAAFTDAITAGVQNSAGTLTTAASTLSANVINTLRGILSYGQGYSIGAAMIQAVASGANSMGGVLASAMRSLANQAISAFKAALDMHSPPRVFTEIGELIPVAVGIGTDDNASVATDAIRRLAEDVTDAWVPPEFDAKLTSNPGNTGTGGGSDDDDGRRPVEVNFYGDVYMRDEEEIEHIATVFGDKVDDITRGGGDK